MLKLWTTSLVDSVDSTVSNTMVLSTHVGLQSTVQYSSEASTCGRESTLWYNDIILVHKRLTWGACTGVLSVDTLTHRGS